jgi:signal transduction histidine kinase
VKIDSLIQRWGLLRIFALSGFVSIISISIVSGFIYFSFLQKNLLQREMTVSAEFIQSVSLINNPEAYFKGSTNIEDKQAIEEFFHHVIGIPDVFRTIIFDADYKIIWSNDSKIIGKRFSDNDELTLAYTGESIFKQGERDQHAKVEHDFLPEDVDQFVESYIPVWNKKHEKVIGVVELYKSPRALFGTLQSGRLLVALVSLLGGLILYGLLYWIVRTAHQLIESQRRRIKQASSRVVELNEQSLRRIGSELHDGPVQSIGFALLKLDSIFEPGTDSPASAKSKSIIIDKIQAALKDALQEVRSLSAGLVIPELKDLSAIEAVTKVIEKHESRTSTTVSHQLKNIPDKLSTPTKICIYRLVQEGLNNAYRHGGGIDQFVSVTVQDTQLILSISDGGPGMDPDDTERINDTEHLGLRGMRERVESLGGDFHITNTSEAGGVTLIAAMPIDE